ncbi:hypothetical protein DM01DRAFT_1327182 [Hesseltinella vesiculosa]|uniref:Helicase C-terminal domain-containing protein n=1 Tax=Hesseltinella vesiculosa TaxID=101127 RepID=A0A1X2G7P4_9FUNG|nr:hypothetical protein DM01DRAFT_1327182 [Hesseltinella vesiculosa]
MPQHSFVRIRIDILLFAIDYTDLPIDISLHQDFIHLLDRIDASPIDQWPDRLITHPRMAVLPSFPHQSLMDVFTSMPSPTPHPLTNIDPLARETLQAVTSQPRPSGMKTNLYQYQKNSLWKILQRELAPMDTPFMTVLKCHSANGTPFYYDLLMGLSSLDPPKCHDICGGIICEDMGTGKTCICLSAVMATKHILTPIRHRTLICDFHTTYADPRNGTTVPSLRSMAAHQALLYGMDWRDVQSNLPPALCSVMATCPPYYEWELQRYRSTIDRPRRGNISIPVLKVYPSSATLIVVPDNLVAQWYGEIYKHINDGELRFLVLEHKTKMPTATDLLHYDLVLMGSNVFANEDSSGGLDFVSIPRPCQCPYIGITRIRDCKCTHLFHKPTYTSPLLQVHWKRVIVDEGHTLSSKSSRQSSLAAKLFFNALWICTGTPTQNLTEATSHARRANLHDDLARLGVFYTDILKLPPFAGRAKLWNKSVAGPVKKGTPWAMAGLYETMCRTMIRNQKLTIEQEVNLPPLHVNIVYLDFDYYQWLAHNCQISLISLNAILSERVGPDYLFSKQNSSALRQTISNMLQSCTWLSADMASVYAAHSHCKKALDKIHTKGHTFGQRDDADLERILWILDQAIADPVFVAMMSKHEVSFVVQGLPPLMREQWGWHNGARGAYQPISTDVWHDHCLVSGDIVIDLSNDVKATKNDPSKNLYVYNSRTRILESTEVYDKRQLDRKRSQTSPLRRKVRKVRAKEADDAPSNPPANQAKTNKKKKPMMKKPKPVLPSSELIASMLPAKTPSVQLAPAGNATATQPPTTPHGNSKKRKLHPHAHINEQDDSDVTAMTFYTRNVFSDVRVLCSTSVKINYLVDQVLRYQHKEKCIIFCQYYNEMQEIYLALRLVNVRVLMYPHSQMLGKKRAQEIVTFNTSDNANVMLMAVQRAAFGIDLSSASRVYFVSPVWQTATEQQAIKRAHRIGQTRPVHVEILVIRHSIEDAMLQRRQHIPEQEQETMTDHFYNDKPMQDSLNHVNLVPLPSHLIKAGDSYNQPIMLLDKPIWLIPEAAAPLSPNMESQPLSIAMDLVSPLPAQPPTTETITVEDDDDVLTLAQPKKAVRFA